MHNFKALADGDADFFAAREAEHVVGHGISQRAAIHQLGFQQAMGDDHPARGQADGNGRPSRSVIKSHETFRTVPAYLKGQAAECLSAGGGISVRAQHFEPCIAYPRQIEGLIVCHGMCPFPLGKAVAGFVVGSGV